MTPSIKEALEQIIAADQRETYRTIECDAAGNTMELIVVDGPCAKIARAALATFPPSGEGREAIVTQVQGILGDKLTIDCLNDEIDGVGPASYAIVDLLLASGLVQNEAGVRANHPGPDFDAIDRRADQIDAAIRSARDGGAET